MYKLTILLIIVLLSACASSHLSSVEVIKNSDLEFTGKGAGAGVMLMSVIGPAGIAIGVAIDVGITKDINETAIAGDLDLDAIIKTKLSPYLQTQTHPVTITIERYGFVKWSGEGTDPTTAQLHLSINTGDNIEKIRYPDDFDKETTVFQTAELSSVKTNIHDIEGLLSSAASLINTKLLQ